MEGVEEEVRLKLHLERVELRPRQPRLELGCLESQSRRLALPLPKPTPRLTPLNETEQDPIDGDVEMDLAEHEGEESDRLEPWQDEAEPPADCDLGERERDRGGSVEGRGAEARALAEEYPPGGEEDRHRHQAAHVPVGEGDGEEVSRRLWRFVVEIVEQPLAGNEQRDRRPCGHVKADRPEAARPGGPGVVHEVRSSPSDRRSSNTP